MFSKDFSLCALFDRYGALLTEKQRSAFSLYYNEDFSLSEIAEHTQTTRQAVRSLIAKTETELRRFESALGLCAKETQIARILKEASPAPDEGTREMISEILNVIKE